MEIVAGTNGLAGETSDLEQTGFSTPSLDHLVRMNYKIILV